MWYGRQVTPNYGFILSEIERECGPGARVLDFGCGQGTLVEAGRFRGFRMVGADCFQLPEEREAARAKLGSTIHEMPGGVLPFADASFDAVCANMVLEHVENLDLALAEIGRVLRPGGVFLSMMPSKESIREDHCGIPLAHRLQRWPALQFAWLLGCRVVGLGHYRDSRTRVQWARDFRDYLQAFTFYRTDAELCGVLGTIGRVERREPAFAKARLGMALPAAVVVRLGTMVCLARKPEGDVMRAAA